MNTTFMYKCRRCGGDHEIAVAEVDKPLDVFQCCFANGRAWLPNGDWLKQFIVHQCNEQCAGVAELIGVDVEPK